MKASNTILSATRLRFRLPDGEILTFKGHRRVSLDNLQYATRLFRKHGITLLPLAVVA